MFGPGPRNKETSLELRVDSHWTGHVFFGMTNYFVTLWKEEWLENAYDREAGEGYKC